LAIKTTQLKWTHLHQEVEAEEAVADFEVVADEDVDEAVDADEVGDVVVAADVDADVAEVNGSQSPASDV